MFTGMTVLQIIYYKPQNSVRVKSDGVYYIYFFFCLLFFFDSKRKISGLRDSNPPPQPWEGRALPDELNPH